MISTLFNARIDNLIIFKGMGMVNGNLFNNAIGE
jgi:hypothetical protein